MQVDLKDVQADLEGFIKKAHQEEIEITKNGR